MENKKGRGLFLIIMLVAIPFVIKDIKKEKKESNDKETYIENLSDLNKEKLKKFKDINLKNYYKISNFNVNNYYRYEQYKNLNPSLSYKDVVTNVNINNDLEEYTNTKETKNPNDLLVLVNKYNSLPKNYKPKDLEYVDGAYGDKVPMRKIIINDFKELQKQAKKEININLMPTTAFRDYEFQNTLYTNYVKKDGKKKADKYSARPGYSEHQTGLAIDLKNMALKDIRLTEENYKWLKENSYKYGFIIRFPENKVNITRYQKENWHIRYVGKKVAKIIYEKDLALEEYIDLYITKY